MVVILRANQIYSQPGKPGRLPTGKSHFYEEIEPRLEKVVLGPKAVGYTERSLNKLIEEGIGEAERDRRPRGTPTTRRQSHRSRSAVLNSRPGVRRQALGRSPNCRRGSGRTTWIPRGLR